VSSGAAPGTITIRDKQKKILSRMAEHIRVATASLNKTGKTETIDDLLNQFKSSGDSLAGALVKTKPEKDLAEPGETEEELKKRRDRERDEIDKKMADIEGKLLHTEQQIQVCATEILQLTATLQKEADKTAELKKKYLDLKTTMDLLSNPEENMKKMKEMAIKQKNDLVKLAMKWEETRGPTVEEYRALECHTPEA